MKEMEQGIPWGFTGRGTKLDARRESKETVSWRREAIERRAPAPKGVGKGCRAGAGLVHIIELPSEATQVLKREWTSEKRR